MANVMKKILNILNSQLEHFILSNSLFIQVQIDPSILELGRLFNLMKRIFWNTVYLQLEHVILTYNDSTQSILLANPIKIWEAESDLGNAIKVILKSDRFDRNVKFLKSFSCP